MNLQIIHNISFFFAFLSEICVMWYSEIFESTLEVIYFLERKVLHEKFKYVCLQVIKFMST